VQGWWRHSGALDASWMSRLQTPGTDRNRPDSEPRSARGRCAASSCLHGNDSGPRSSSHSPAAGVECAGERGSGGSGSGVLGSGDCPLHRSQPLAGCCSLRRRQRAVRRATSRHGGTATNSDPGTSRKASAGVGEPLRAYSEWTADMVSRPASSPRTRENQTASRVESEGLVSPKTTPPTAKATADPRSWRVQAKAENVHAGELGVRTTASEFSP
jgi:hypothetical protein